MPPTLTVATPDGRSLDIWLAGPEEGRPLFFHYGTPSSGRPYDGHAAAAAARGIRLVSYARPGYAGSTRHAGRRVVDAVADTRAILDHLGIDRAHVAGWSGGGPHALAHAALLPDRVLGTAILAGVAPWGAEGIDWFAGMGAENVTEFQAALDGPEALLPVVEPGVAAMADMQPEELVASLGDLVDEVDAGALDDPMLADWLARVMREGMRTGVWGMFDDDIAFTMPWGFDPGIIRSPVHVWQGGHDRMVPFGHGRWLAANCGGACPHLDPAQGHLSLVVDRFGDILDELLDPRS
ncbi:MAG TPA: alpha/beta hydrolase [Candidatus Limnocylindrales bacterium]|nr:alpha/beta hydrolase [Candidatus Limnocylindrales bacterium]